MFLDRRIRVGYAWARFANEAAKRNFDLLAFKPTEYAPEEFVPKAVVNHSTISVDAPKAYAE